MPCNPAQLPQNSIHLLKWKTIFKDDLCLYLKCRAREFKPNGLFALQICGRRPLSKKGYLGCKNLNDCVSTNYVRIKTNSSFLQLYDAKMELLRLGVINRVQCEKLYTRFFLRSKDEIEESLRDVSELWSVEEFSSYDITPDMMSNFINVKDRVN